MGRELSYTDRPKLAVARPRFNINQLRNMMERSLIDHAWPNSLRWFLTQGLIVGAD